MNTYELLLKHGKAQLNTNQNGEELICFYPNQLKKAIEITQFNAQLHPLTDEEIEECYWGDGYPDNPRHPKEFARAILKKASKK